EEAAHARFVPRNADRYNPYVRQGESSNGAMQRAVQLSLEEPQRGYDTESSDEDMYHIIEETRRLHEENKKLLESLDSYKTNSAILNIAVEAAGMDEETFKELTEEASNFIDTNIPANHPQESMQNIKEYTETLEFYNSI